MGSNLDANVLRDTRDGAKKSREGIASSPRFHYWVPGRIRMRRIVSGRHSAASAGSAHYLGSYFFFLALAFGAAFFFLAGFLAFFLAGMDDSPLSFRSSGVREEKRFAHSCAQ